MHGKKYFLGSLRLSDSIYDATVCLTLTGVMPIKHQETLSQHLIIKFGNYFHERIEF